MKIKKIEIKIIEEEQFENMIKKKLMRMEKEGIINF